MAAFALLTAMTGVAAADDAARAAARRLATAGVDAYQRDEYATAVDKLERAYAMLQAPSVGLWLARALVKQGKLVAANERYLEVGRLNVTGGDAAVQEAAKRDAASEVEALTPLIPTVIVQVEGAVPTEVTLELDGKPLATAVLGEQQPVDPGKHRIQGKRGVEVVTEEVSVAQKENKTVTLRFRGPAAPASPIPAAASSSGVEESAASDRPASSGGSTRKVLAWSAIGLGAAGVLTGAVSGGLALSKKGELDDSPDCVNRVCFNGTMRDDLDGYDTLRTVSTIGFIAGGVLAATGITLLLTSPSSAVAKAEHRAWVHVGASGVTAGGWF